MKHKEMDWKAWLAVIIIVIIIGGIASGMRASAESTTPTDLPVVDDEGTYWLDEVEGEVILDDPAYFMDFEEEEPAAMEETETTVVETEILLADVLSSDAEATAEPVVSVEETVQAGNAETIELAPTSSAEEAATTAEGTPEVTDAVKEDADPSSEESTVSPEETPETSEQPDSPADTPTIEETESPVDTEQSTNETVEDSTDEPASDPTVTPDVPTTTPDTPAEQPTDTPEQSDQTEQPEAPEQPEETEQPPVDLKTLFDVDIKVPSGWRNSYSATVRIKITPSSDQMWHKVRYRIGAEEWETVPDKDFVLYDGYYYTDIEVYYNAKMSVRLFSEEENYFDTNKEIKIFDHNAPEVTAGFRDLVLHVEAVDDLSEVAGIQVNSLLFTTLVDGMLDVRMEEPLLEYKQLAIRAYDYAGNFSAPVTLDNPYYVEPTPEPTATPKPTKKPTTTKKPNTTKKPSSGSSSSTTSQATATPVVTATPAPTAVTPQQQIVYVTPDPNMYSYYQPQVTAEPETVYVPLGPGQPYKSEGNMQTMDMLYSASTNKQFITVQTRAGETYYMVIDYDKPIDEENDIYETYFLNLVDDRDLMSVVSEDEIEPTPTPQIVYVTPEPTQIPQQTAPIVVEDDGMEEMLPTILLIGGVAAVGGAIFWMMKKKKEDAARNVPDFDDEYEFEDEEESDE